MRGIISLGILMRTADRKSSRYMWKEGPTMGCEPPIAGYAHPIRITTDIGCRQTCAEVSRIIGKSIHRRRTEIDKYHLTIGFIPCKCAPILLG